MPPAALARFCLARINTSRIGTETGILRDGPDKNKESLYKTEGGDWRLTTSEKKRILLNNIYGVDIDAQAVEVTKLSLLLRVLEGESDQTLGNTLRLFHERALPDLGNNIKCGNSLIASDFYQYQQLLLIDDEERFRINVFDWAGNDGFPSIMKAGGFDAVIGNPPWGGDIDKELEYFHARYPATTRDHTDSFKLFVEAGIRIARRAGLVSDDRSQYNLAAKAAARRPRAAAWQ